MFGQVLKFGLQGTNLKSSILSEHGLIITVLFGSSLDQNPVLPTVYLELPTPLKFKVTRKRLKCLENAFPAINFSKFSIFWGSALWASCLRCLRANRRSTNFNPVLSGKHARAPPPKNEIDFTLYTYAIQA